MDMDQAAVFLAGSILTMLGFTVVVAGVIVINNLIHKFWKPVQLWLPSTLTEPKRFATPEEMERIAPHFDPISKEPHPVKETKK
jgi:hypothetical protein